MCGVLRPLIHLEHESLISLYKQQTGVLIAHA